MTHHNLNLLYFSFQFVSVGFDQVCDEPTHGSTASILLRSVESYFSQQFPSTTGQVDGGRKGARRLRFLVNIRGSADHSESSHDEAVFAYRVGRS